MLSCVTIANLLLAAAIPAAPPASEVMAAAEAQATAQHKNIFLIFHASWCTYCRQLDTFLAAPENRGVVDKYFVVVHLTIQEYGAKASLNHPGGIEVRDAVGGKNTALPFFAFLDSRGTLIVNTINSRGVNIGYPDAPEEIDWFLVMLKKAVPAMTHEEAATLETWLRSNGKKG
jgi:thiol-disulfide isomerase/thioredoxin